VCVAAAANDVAGVQQEIKEIKEVRQWCSSS
jgi:hypothetical protein